MAADVYFTTNPSDFTRLEGLYVSERNPPGFIRGRDLSVVAMAGLSVRGPASPVTVTSTARFLEVFGGRDRGTASGLALTNELWKALLNKPFGTLVLERVTGTGAVASSLTLDDNIAGGGTDILRLDASSVGLWGQDVEVKVEDASNGNVLHFNVVARYLGVEYVFENLNCQAGFDNLAEVVGDDLARVLDLVKLADGRPVNTSTVTEVTLVAARSADDFVPLGDVSMVVHTNVPGTEGTLAATDYTAAVTNLASIEGPSTVLVPESLEDTVAAAAQATLNATIVTLAAAVSDRMFLTWSGIVGQDAATEIASQAADITTRSDRIVWCHNAANTVDPETGLKVSTGPHVWMASIFSQNDVDIHPGAQQTSTQTAGVSSLANESLSRGDLILLRDAGISTLEKLPGQFLFRSGVTTDLTTGKTEIARRRAADFLQLSASDRLRFFVKAKNTLELRAGIAGELTAFSQTLKDQTRIVEDFSIDQESVNSAGQRAQGVEKILWRVKLIGHVLHLVLETEIGTGVVIEAA